MCRPVVRALVVACLVLGWPRGATAHPHWIRVDTPNFIVVGTGERHLANIGAAFEGFREALRRLVSKNAVTSPVPTVVFVFPDDRSFEPFKPRYEGQSVNVGALYASQPHINYILLGPAHADDDDLRGVFHEFTHLVIRNTSPGIPLWLNEGLAEYYSAFRIENDGRAVVIGGPIESHLRVLARERWIPLPELIATDQSSAQYNERSRRSMFYAESWLLVHMLLQRTPDRSSEVARYVDQTLAGVPSDAAWAQAFGRDDVMASLRQYAERPMLKSERHIMPAPIEAAGGSEIPFSESDRAMIFDEAMVALGRKDQAPPRKLNASSADWFDDYMVAADLFASGVPAEQADRRAALEALDRVLAKRPDLLNALSMCGILDDITGRDPPRAVEYLRAVHRAVPARDDYSLAFAEALARSGEFASAKAVVQDVIDHPHLEGMKQQAL